jgi:hypothetical protein
MREGCGGGVTGTRCVSSVRMSVLVVGNQLTDGAVVDFVGLHVARSLICCVNRTAGIAWGRSRGVVVEVSPLSLAGGVCCG